MKNYVIPLCLTIPADSFEEAMAVAASTADNVAIDAGIGVVIPECEHDNEGRRVLYLHPEETPPQE